ncbi:MAG TPA: twin-arginine translocase TatA/TatE family subunit [Anaerolineae bacterium]|nr:twin-arginine translocase TatA/TatE family subunit [Anaerolineae bacterium]
MPNFGPTELLIILVIVVLIFGVGKVADVGPALGKAISGFRKAMREDEEESAPLKAETDTEKEEQE